MSLNRRRFLEHSVLGSIGLALPSASRAQRSLRTTAIGDGLRVVTGAGTNVLVLATRDGIALVDGGLAAESERVLDESGRVELLFNTNWRPEHTGLNLTVGPRGARIVAHENTKLWLGNEFTVRWEGSSHSPYPAAALPNETFYTTTSVELGGEALECGYLERAHTDGDIYVFLPDRNVLVASDALAVDGYPTVDYVTGGWIGGLERATETLLEITDAQTRIVPARGPIVSRAALESQLALCTTMREAVRDAYRNGLSAEEFVALEPAAPFTAERGDPELFLNLVYEGAWGHARELGAGII